MALTYGVGGGGTDFEPVAAGTHFGVCTGMVDIGLQPGSALYPKPKRILYLRFEIPAERVEIDGKDAPAIIYERFSASMNKKALLRAALESWRGKPFTDEEAAEFDISKVLGASCTLSVIHNKGGNGKTYANVSAIGPLPKGMAKLDPENPLVLYHPGDKSQFDQVPKFLQEKIRGQLQPESESDVEERQAAEHAPAFQDDDIPF